MNKTKQKQNKTKQNKTDFSPEKPLTLDFLSVAANEDEDSTPRQFYNTESCA